MNERSFADLAAPRPSSGTYEDWKNTVLAGLANYIDAGSIVASSAALSMWAEAYKLNGHFLGVVAALSANGFSAGVGAVIGGRLCDLFGRKTIYQWDLLLYDFGIVWLVIAVRPWMIVVGTLLVGLAVGADLPASWSLIAEMAPPRQRGKHSGVAQLLWCLGPIVVLGLSFLLAPMGIVGIRIVFAHLGILAIALTVFRSKMRESEPWKIAKTSMANPSNAALQELLSPRHLRAMVFLIGMYGTWALFAGTSGFFWPYILRTIGGQSQAASVAIQALGFLVATASIGVIFMRFSDQMNQRVMFLGATAIQVVGVALLAMLPLTTEVALLHIVLVAVGSGFGAQPFFQLWSAELFPTRMRTTAQGLTFSIVRFGLGGWSLFVPVLAATKFSTLAWILTGFLVLSGIAGAWAPRNEGKSLDEISDERAIPGKASRAGSLSLITSGNSTGSGEEPSSISPLHGRR